MTEELFHMYPTITEFASTNSLPDPLLCFAMAKIDDRDEGHTFAIDGGSYIDNNTSGMILTASDIPTEVASFRVNRYYRIRSQVG
jgi:hypothetical protein